MKPAPFEYFAPRTMEEAAALLRQNGAEAKLLAGGQSLMPLLNFRLARPSALIDLNTVVDLGGIEEVAEGLAIGAMTRQGAVERSPAVRERCPLLAEAVRRIGHAAVRHRGTIGGSLAHADPAAELPAVALALDARLELARDGKRRALSAREFFIDYLTTALGPDELLAKIVFPRFPAASGCAVEEITRRHGDYAIAGVAAAVELDSDGKIAAARIALFGVAPTALRADRAEAALKGQNADPETVRGAVALLGEVLDPPSDIHASGAYRKRVTPVLAARAIMRAVAMAGGSRLQ